MTWDSVSSAIEIMVKPNVLWVTLPRLEKLQIVCPRFRKFTINYIGNIKIPCPRSRLQDRNFPDWHIATLCCNVTIL